MIQLIKDKLHDKRVRTILGILTACALCVAIFPYAFAAYGTATNANKSESSSTQSVSSEKSTSSSAVADSKAADSKVKAADDKDAESKDADAKTSDAKDGSDAESGKAAIAASAVDGTQPAADVDTDADAEDDAESNEEAEEASSVLSAQEEVAEEVTEEDAEKVNDPSWITVSEGMTSVFDDENANSVTVTGPGSFTLKLEQNNSYTITIEGDVAASGITVPAGATLNLNGGCTLNGTTTIDGEFVASDITVPADATLNLNGSCTLDDTTTINGSVNGACTFSGKTAISGSVKGDCTFNGDTTVSGIIDGAIVIPADSTLSLQGNGALSGSATINGTVNGGINVASDKTLNLEGTAIINGVVNGNVIVPEKKTLKLENLVAFKGIAKIDGALQGHIKVDQGTELNLQGRGMLEGIGYGSVVTVEGQDAKLVVGAGNDVRNAPGDNCLTITKGNGSQLHTDAIWNHKGANGRPDDQIFRTQDETAGGAILVRRLEHGDSASLVINNVNIKENHAQSGGGIYIDRDCVFTMNNGLITDNTTQSASSGSAHEGGGIVVAGTGRIYKAQILRNTTNTTMDWGGGGIFIESAGNLDFGKKSVLITTNRAVGLGGGISGCPHAEAGIGDIGGNSDAIVICSNEAKGEDWLSNGDNQWLWKMSNGTGDNLFFNSKNLIKKGDIYVLAENLTNASQDYYCTGNSYIGLQSYATQGDAWTGVCIKASDKKETPVVINNEQPWFECTDASLGLTAGAPTQPIDSGEFDVVIQNNTSNTHGGGIGCNGSLTIGSLPSKNEMTCDWDFELQKEFRAEDGTSYLEAGQFTFGLYSDDKCDNLLKTAANDADGKIRFEFNDQNYLPTKDEAVKDVDFYVKEIVDSRDPFIKYDEDVRKVTVRLQREESQTVSNGVVSWPYNHVKINAKLVSCTKLNSDADDANTFKNVFKPYGTFSMLANKTYYGNVDQAAAEKLTFSMNRINEPKAVESDGSTSYVLDSEVLSGFEDEKGYQGKISGEFVKNNAEIKFEDVTLKLDDEALKNGSKDYWFMITEDSSEISSTDPRIYVVKVQACLTESREVITDVIEVYYAEELLEKTVLTRLDNVDGEVPQVEFTNFGNGLQSVSLYGYAIKAASNEPVEQECFVDPKIIKNLEGRSLAPDEFNFKLIEVIPEGGKVNWNNIQGDVISETTNDSYGMVDFDKANNVSGDLENPSCLAYTAPGTYYYRVVEATESKDASIDYSDQVITFTTVIERQDNTLVCTDMYYGHVVDGVNVRYEESSNPQWHPTITNYAKGIDLQVRKTSALDRDNGLEGATYGLYAVNSGAQADILMGEATSDDDGWITFENVSLKEGTLYYFKERLAPAGHTVSEFRSGFFYLVKDKSAPNGYVMMYTDNKMELGQADAETTLSAMDVSDDATIQKDANAPAGPVSKNGNMLFKYERDGGVYDEATQVEFNKLDTQTHEWVEGAKLAIIDKATGKTVNEWTSGKAAENLKGVLNVDTTYILREVEAPEGYAKAGDVEFEIDQYGAVSIISGASNGNAEIQGSAITLYDTMLSRDGSTPGNDKPNNNTPGTDTPNDETPGGGSSDDEDTPERNFGLPVRTGDLLKFGGILILAGAAIFGMVLFSRRKYKPQHSSKK